MVGARLEVADTCVEGVCTGAAKEGIRGSKEMGTC